MVFKIKVGGLFKFDKLAPEVKNSIKKRLAEKGAASGISSIKIDGRPVTKENISSFKPKPKKLSKTIMRKTLKAKTMKELRKLAKGFKIRGRWSFNEDKLIDELIKVM